MLALQALAAEAHSAANISGGLLFNGPRVINGITFEVQITGVTGGLEGDGLSLRIEDEVGRVAERTVDWPTVEGVLSADPQLLEAGREEALVQHLASLISCGTSKKDYRRR